MDAAPVTSPETSPSGIPTIEPPSPPGDEAAPVARPWRVLALAIAFALIAGAASLLIGETIVKVYQAELQPALRVRPSAEDLRQLDHGRVYSAAGTFGVLGGLLGLALGLAGGIARGSAGAAARAGAVCLVLGAVGGAAVSAAMVRVYYAKYDPHSDELTWPLLTHASIWATVGAIGGLGLGLGLGPKGRWKATLAGGIAGAIAATLAYEILGALIFPAEKTHLPLSTSAGTRAMAQMLVAALAAAGAALAPRPEPAGPPQPTSPA